MTDIDDSTPVWQLTVGQLRALLAPPASTDDSPMTADDVCQRRPVTPGWLRAHVMACGRGAQQRKLYRLSDVDAALTSAPVLPRTRKCASDDVDPIDEALASGELVRR